MCKYTRYIQTLFPLLQVFPLTPGPSPELYFVRGSQVSDLKLVDCFSLIKLFLPSLNSTICHREPVGPFMKMRQLREEKETGEKKKSKTIHLPKPLLPNPTELEDFEVDLKLNLD